MPKGKSAIQKHANRQLSRLSFRFSSISISFPGVATTMCTPDLNIDDCQRLLRMHTKFEINELKSHLVLHVDATHAEQRAQSGLAVIFKIGN